VIPLIPKFMFSTAWWVVLAILAAAFFIALIVLRRRGRAEEPEARAEAGLGRRDLLNSYRAFHDALPRSGKQHLRRGQHVVVLGEAGSGKTRLIDRFTDWKDKTAQHFPSRVDDPRVQFYLATRQIVTEIGPTLLEDSSPRARRAMRTLWSSLYKRHTPIALIALSAESIELLPAARLRTFAARLRSRLELLERCSAGPVRVQIALVGGQHFPGLATLSRDLAAHGVPLRFDLATGAPLSEQLDAMQAHLPYALGDTGGFREVMRFFREGPRRWMPQVEAFLEHLRRPDPMLPAPTLEHLYLLTDDADEAALNPLELSAGARRDAWDLYSLRHHFGAAAAALILAALPTLQYFSERADLREDIDELQARREALLDARVSIEEVMEGVPECARRAFGSRFATRLEGVLDPHIAGRELCYSLQGQLRHSLQRLLFEVPLREAANQGDFHRALLALGLMATRPEDALFDLMSADPEPWDHGLELPEGTTLAWLDIQGPQAPWPEFHFHDARATADETWHLLLGQIRDALDQETADLVALERLQALSERLMLVLEGQEIRVATIDLLKRQGSADVLMASGMNLDDPGGLWENQWSQQYAEELKGILRTVHETGICRPTRTARTMGVLLEQVEGCALYTSQPLLTYTAPPFEFKPIQWEALVVRSAVSQLVESFQRHHPGAPPLVAGAYASVSSKEGGADEVPGAFTRAAVVSEVLPTYADLAARLDSARLHADLRRRLEELADAALGSYASDYAEAWHRFYESWRPRSVGRVRSQVSFAEFASPGGPKIRFLRQVAENTRLVDLDAPELLLLQQELRSFDARNAVLGDPGAPDPTQGPIADYLSILEEVNDQLRAERVEANFGGGAGEEVGLAASLSLGGKMVLAEMTDPEASYITLARAVLESIGVEPAYQGPLLTPFTDLYAIGVEDLEVELSRKWGQLNSRLRHHLKAYPFSPAAERELSLEAFIEEFAPDGRFWADFERDIAPVCQEFAGRWSLRRGLRGPRAMIDQINRVAALTDGLWDEQGAPREVSFMVRTVPFEDIDIEGWYTTDAYLQVGAEAVHAYNQRAEWEAVSLRWWDQKDAQIILQIQGPSRKKSYAPLIWQAERGEWGFLRLLDQAARRSDHWTWSWEGALPGESAPRAVSVSFRLDKDPRATFTRMLKNAPEGY